MTDVGWAQLCILESAESQERVAKTITAKPGRFGYLAPRIASAHLRAARVFREELAALKRLGKP